jgi:Gly-Xaa carboxypeptidase
MEKSLSTTYRPVASPYNGGGLAGRIRHRIAWALISLSFAYLVVFRIAPQAWWSPESPPNYAAQCVQPDALFPKDNTDLAKAFDFISSSEFKNATIKRLFDAVKIKTETFDDLGEIGVDKRWEVFYPFFGYLEKTFPSVHEKLKVEKVNTHGLLYTWQGSNADLKPTVLMAHQDTVPVPAETVSISVMLINDTC